MADLSRRRRVSLLDILLILAALVVAGAGVLVLSGPKSGSHEVLVLENRIRELRRFRTVSQTYRSVIFAEERAFLLGSRQVLFTLEYQVSAGVDFSRGFEIRELDRGVVEVRMPPAEVFAADADESSIRQMFIREQSFWNPVRMGDYMPQVVAQGEANRTAALESGILDRAEANARKAVSRILRLGGVEDIRFAAASEAVDG